MLQVQLTGVRECLAALTHIPNNIQRREMHIAMSAAGGIIKAGAVSRVQQRTKLLKQALAVKVTQKKNGHWYVVVGAKRGMKRAIKVTAKGKTRALSKRATSNLRFTPGGGGRTYVDPARYIHLAEKGTKQHTISIKNKRVMSGNGGIWGTRVSTRAKASRFMATAAATAGPAAVQKAITKLREAILRYAK